MELGSRCCGHLNGKTGRLAGKVGNVLRTGDDSLGCDGHTGIARFASVIGSWLKRMYQYQYQAKGLIFP